MPFQQADEIRSRLLAAYDSFLQENTRQDRNLWGGKWNLSLSKVSMCPRFLIFSHVVGDELVGERDRRTTGIFTAGLWWEEFLARYAFADFERQCVTVLEGLVGHCDFLYHDRSTGEVTLLECKTVTELPTYPYPNHVVQLSAYMVGVQENGYTTQGGEYFSPATVSSCKGYLVYIERDNPIRFEVFEVEPLPDIKERVRMLVSVVEAFEKDGTLPPIPSGYSALSFPCFVETYHEVSLCPFHQKCWGNTLSLTKSSDPVRQKLSDVMLSEAFRRWIVWKEGEKSYRHFIENVLKPLLSTDLEGLERTINVSVQYLSTVGLLRVYRRRPTARLDTNLLKNLLENYLGVSIPDEDWVVLLEEAKRREGEPAIVIEFRKQGEAKQASSSADVQDDF